MSDSEQPQPQPQPKKGRGPGRQFARGQSGNPGGRPAVPPTLREWCALTYPEALTTIRACLADPDGRVALKAAEIVVSRAAAAGVVCALPPAPATLEEQRTAAEAHLLRLGLAGETAALKAWLAANDPRYRPTPEEGTAGQVDALAFVPVVTTSTEGPK